MSVEQHLLPTHSEATFNSMQTERTVTRIAFNPSTANPGDVLYVTVPKLAQDVVIVPDSLFSPLRHRSDWWACEQLFGV